MGTKYIDLQFLMNSVRNDVDQVKELIHDVLELNAVSISSLNTAFKNSNFAEIKSTAHMLKSSADIFDSILYKEKLIALEHAAKAEEKDAVEKALKEINEVAAVWEEQLRQELKRISGD